MPAPLGLRSGSPASEPSLLQYLELDTAVLGAACVRLVVGDGLRRTDAARLDAVCAHALVDQPLLDRVSALLRKLVVEGRVTLARGVARDLDADARELLQHLDRCVQKIGRASCRERV